MGERKREKNPIDWHDLSPSSMNKIRSLIKNHLVTITWTLLNYVCNLSIYVHLLQKYMYVSKMHKLACLGASSYYIEVLQLLINF